MSKPNKITTVSFICKLGRDTLKLLVLQSGDRKPGVLGCCRTQMEPLESHRGRATDKTWGLEITRAELVVSLAPGRL